MVYYLILYFISIVSLFIYRYKRIKLAKVVPYIAMSFFCGFRGLVGVDTISYIHMYNYISNGVPVKAEAGFYWIVKLAQNMGLGYQSVFLVISILTSVFIYRFISSMSINFELSTIIYLCIGPFYFSSYNTIREALAVAIFLNALKHLDYNLIKYYLWILVACLFHTSAILFMILPLFNKLFLRKYALILLLSFTLILILFIRMEIISFLINNIFTNYKNYIGGHYQKMDLSYSILCFVCLTIIIFNHFKLIKISELDLKLTLITVVLIMVPLITNQYTMIFTRIASYVTPFLIISIPKFNKLVRPKYAWDIFILIICTTYYFILLSTNSSMSNYSFNFNVFL